MGRNSFEQTIRITARGDTDQMEKEKGRNRNCLVGGEANPGKFKGTRILHVKNREPDKGAKIRYVKRNSQ